MISDNDQPSSTDGRNVYDIVFDVVYFDERASFGAIVIKNGKHHSFYSSGLWGHTLTGAIQFVRTLLCNSVEDYCIINLYINPSRRPEDDEERLEGSHWKKLLTNKNQEIYVWDPEFPTPLPNGVRHAFSACYFLAMEKFPPAFNF